LPDAATSRIAAIESLRLDVPLDPARLALEKDMEP